MSIPQKKLSIGLFGFGVVGTGLYKVLQQTPSLNAEIKKVCIKHPEKKREAPETLFTVDPDILLNDESINVIVELIDDADAAYYIVSKALTSGKAVVSANKKMIAEHLPELLAIQKEYGTPFLYESACCASIPVIRNLEEYYDNDLLQGVSGIVNGSTNYILTRVAQDKLTFEEALLQAQIEGFAESNPALDVEGIDAVNKLSILLTHAYGIVAHPQEIIHSGIQNLQAHDAVFAKEKGFEIKLVAQAKKLEDGNVAAFVLPQFVDNTNQLYNVRNEYNGVVIESGLADKQFFYGKGAGSFPTASAVLSDLSALRYDYKYEYKKLHNKTAGNLSNDFFLRVYVSFEGLFQVPHERFERIEEWSSSEKKCHVIGVIKFSKLRDSQWWKKKGISVIVWPDAFVTDVVVKEPVEDFLAVV
ncbi:MAG: homoserine dehydrogenase [Bacteroidetes bacterium 43-93]|nr:homoserine dehydrogenase [Bacteroidota bacterium]OJW96159.1 MAG: homoserine dehydrogenase [Bacteroidetes bacterium 43-93]